MIKDLIVMYKFIAYFIGAVLSCFLLLILIATSSSFFVLLYQIFFVANDVIILISILLSTFILAPIYALFFAKLTERL